MKGTGEMPKWWAVSRLGMVTLVTESVLSRAYPFVIGSALLWSFMLVVTVASFLDDY
jgi:hypothetical protein